MALQWQSVFLPLLFAIIANCSSLPNDFSGDYHPQIWSVLDYLNSDPNRVYNYNFGYFVSARKQTENVNDIVLDVEAECVDRNVCSTTLLHCRGFVEYFSATDKYETLPGIRCQVKSQNDDTRFAQGPTEEQVTDDKPNVPEEVIPSIKTPCLGCLMDVNKDAEGSDEFLNIALKHIESERTRKHIVTNILRIQRQVVAGIKYVFLLEIAPTVCPSNVYLVNTELCPVDAQSAPETCLVEFYEKPRLNSPKQIVSNNCTQSQSFALPKNTKPRNDFSNEIDVNGYKKEENYEPTDKGPNFDRIAASDNFEEIGLSPERLAALEAQIIPTDSTEEAKTKTALHVETTKSGIDNSQMGVEDIPSVQTSTDSFYHDKHERRPIMEAFAKLRRIHETLGSFKVKRDVHSSEDSKDSSEETKDPTGGAARKRREAETDEDSNDTSEEAKNVRRKRETDTNEDSKSSSEETKGQEAGNARRKRETDSNEDSKSSSEETKNQEAGNARRKRETDSNEDSKSSSEETKGQEAGNARRKRETDTNEDSKSSSEETKGQEAGNARRKREIDGTDESKSSEEAKTLNDRRKRETKSSEESKDSSDETTDQPGRKKRDAESSEESKETGKIKRESEESLEDIVKEDSDIKESDETLVKRKLRAVANDDDSSSSSSEEDKNDKDGKKHKKAHEDTKKEKHEKKAELKDKDDDSSSSSSDDKDEATERIKRGAKDDSSSSSSSSSDDDDNDDNDDNNGNDKRKHKKASRQRKSKKNDKDDNDKDDDSSSSSSSSSSDDDNDNDVRKRRSIHDMVKPGSEEKLLVKKLANFAASSYDDAHHRNEVLEVLRVKKIELEGAVYHLSMKVGTSKCAGRNSCTFEQEKLCKVQLHVSKDQKIRMLKSHCHNIGKNANENRTDRSKRHIAGGVVTAPVDDDTILGYVDSTLPQLDSKSTHENKYKLLEVLKSTKQVVSGMLYKIKAKLVLSDCSKNDPKHSRDCGELNDAEPKVCDIVIWDQPWLHNGKQTNVTCEQETYQFVAKRSVNLLGRDEHHIHFGLFKNFMSVHNKTYPNDDEMRKRFRIFRDNMKTVELLTKTEQGTAVYGATRFADLTSEEFQAYKGYRPELRNENEMKFAEAVIPDISLPTEFDWRKKGAVAEVKDQGSCGSCWAFSVTGNVEGQYAIKHGQLLEFSEQELVDCDSTDNGCNGGLMDNAYRAIEKLGGLEQEKAYPYEARDDKCHFKKDLAKAQLSGALNISQDETDMAKWLTKNGPISIAINANAMQFYVGGVSHPLKFLCSPKSLDHGVLIVGYGVHKYPLFKKQLPYWIVKNSWGRSWGEQGYYRVYRGDGTCGLNQTPSSAIVV